MKTSLAVVGTCLLVLVAMGSGYVAAQEEGGDQQRGRPLPRGYDTPEYRDAARKLLGMMNMGAAPQLGDEAPDFELMPIRFYDFKTDEAPITKENASVLYEPARLSSFKGRKPVALIFGSYT